MTDINRQFFSAYLSSFPHRIVYGNEIPKEMVTSLVDKDGWVDWKPIAGTLTTDIYKDIENQFNVKFPSSFIDWHKAYFFLDADCSLLRLPSSNPSQPLTEIRRNLDWYIPKQLIPQKLFPFASEGNDAGPLVFDAREVAHNNEFPVRVYEQEYGGRLEGLSEVIFSSFSKLIECITHFMSELKTRQNFEIVPEFFEIDPTGAGKTGVDYWLSWVNLLRENFEEFGANDI